MATVSKTSTTTSGGRRYTTVSYTPTKGVTTPSRSTSGGSGSTNTTKVVSPPPSIVTSSTTAFTGSGTKVEGSPGWHGNVEVKYYKSDGTPVYGGRLEASTVPMGSTPASGANIRYSLPGTQTGSASQISMSPRFAQRLENINTQPSTAINNSIRSPPKLSGSALDYRDKYGTAEKLGQGQSRESFVKQTVVKQQTKVKEAAAPKVSYRDMISKPMIDTARAEPEQTSPTGFTGGGLINQATTTTIQPSIARTAATKITQPYGSPLDIIKMNREQENKMAETFAPTRATFGAIPKDAFKGKRVTNPEEAMRNVYAKESPGRAGVFNPIEKKLEEWQQKTKTSEFKVPQLAPYAGILIGSGLGVSGALKAAVHPIKTVKETAYTISSPDRIFAAGYTAGAVIESRPDIAIGYVGGMYAGGKIISKGVSTVSSKSPIKIEAERLTSAYEKPLEVTKIVEGKESPITISERTKLPFKTSVEGQQKIATTIGVKVGSKGYPLVTTFEKAATKGFEKRVALFETPKGLVVKKTITGEFQPKTATGGKVFSSNIGQFITKESTMLVEGKTISPALQQEFAVKGIAAQEQLFKQQSAFVEPEVLLRGTERLSPPAAKALLDVVTKEKGIAFGSSSTSPQLMSEVRRTVGDIDVYFNTRNELKLQKITQKSLFAIQKTGVKARIPKAEPYHIEVFKGGVWEKAAEFKGEGIGSLGAEVPFKAYGYDLSIPRQTIKLGKYRVASITGESQRKLAASIAIREPGALGVTHTGRFKDVPDYFRIIKTQVESAKLKGKPYSAGEALLKLDKELGISYKTPVEGKVLLAAPKSPSPIRAGGYVPIVPSYKLYSPKSVKSSPSYRIARSSSMSRAISKSLSVSASISPSVSSSISSYISGSVSPKSPSPTSPSPYTPKSYIPSPSPISPSPYVPSPSPYSPSPSPSPSPEIPSPYFTIPSIPGLGGGGGAGGGRGMKSRSPSKYNPSLVATAFGITGKANTAGGIGVRPIVGRVNKALGIGKRRKK